MKHVASGLLVLVLCSVGASAQLAASVWTAGSSDCSSAKPPSTFGTSSVNDSDSKVFFISPIANVPNTGFCPGIAYNVALQFNEKRKFILTSSQGSLSGTTGTPCTNRMVNSVGVTSVGLQLTLACSTTGNVTLKVTSVAANKSTSDTYKQLVVQEIPIAPLSACSVSSCVAAASKPVAGNSAASVASTTSSTTVKPMVLDLASFLKFPKVTFDMNAKPFRFPKIKLNLTIPKAPANVVVNLAMPTIDRTTLASLPAMLESILQQMAAQLKTTAADLGIDLIDESTPTTTTTTTSSTASSTASNVAQAAVSTGDNVAGAFSNIEAWVKAASAMVSGRRLLELQNEFGDLGEQAYPDLELDTRMARTLTAVNQTVKTDVQKISNFVSLASSDFFAISYTSFKTANAALKLLIAYLKASATGTIGVDDLSLLDFVSGVAALGGEMSDLMSRISKLNADAVAPISLSFKFSDIIARLKNNTAVNG